MEDIDNLNKVIEFVKTEEFLLFIGSIILLYITFKILGLFFKLVMFTIMVIMGIHLFAPEVYDKYYEKIKSTIITEVNIKKEEYTKNVSDIVSKEIIKDVDKTISEVTK